MAAACAVFWSFDDPWTLRGDNKVVMFPMNLDAYRSWMSGRIPEWSDAFWSGFPLLADPTSLSLYWPNMLAFLLTPEPHFRAYDLTTAFHAGILVSGVVCLLRLVGVRRIPSLLGGVLIFLAPMHVWYASAMITGYAPVSWWPWMLVSAELLGRSGLAMGSLAIGWIALASCALAYPEFALYGGGVASVWLLTGGSQPLLQRLICAIVLCVGGVALAAPQLASTAMILPEMTRGSEVDLIRELDFVQVALSVDTFLYPGSVEKIPSFLGIATLIVACVGVVSGSPRSWVLAALAGFSFLLALGDVTFLYEGLRAVPIFEMFRGPLKFKLLTELAVVLLAAKGFDHLFKSSRDRAARQFVLVVVGMVLMEHLTYVGMRVWTGAPLPGGSDTSFTEFHRRMTNSSIITHALAGPQPPVSRISERIQLRGLPALMGVPALASGDNALVSRRHRRIIAGYNRVPGPSRAEMNYFAVHYDLAPEPRKTLGERRPCLRDARVRGLLLIGLHDDACLFYNLDRPSRFVVPTKVRREPNVDSMVDSVVGELEESPLILTSETQAVACDAEPANLTPAIVKIVDRRIGSTNSIPVVAPADELRKRSRAFGRVGIIDHQPGDVALLVDSNRPAFVLAKESYFPGWEATVDFEPVPVYPAAGLFFAVPLPSGEHEVHLSYRAPGFRFGIQVALGWLALACTVELLRRIVVDRRARRAESETAA